MSIDYRNHEQYPDPTAFEALTAVEEEECPIRGFRPFVCICSPYAGDTETNVAAARRYSRFAATMGVIPIAPHLLFPQFLDDEDPKERRLGIFFGNAVLAKCAELWVFGSTVSPGMEEEIRRAKWRNYRIRWFNEKCEEVTTID